MLHYASYRNIFPLWALGEYRKHVLLPKKNTRLRLVGVEVMSKEQEHGILEINFRNKMPSKIFKRFSESK
jgi:hypothetical protein